MHLKPSTSEPHALRVRAKGAIGVDHENKAILGYVVAQKGLFKTPGRGQFDDAGLKEIVKLGNADSKGLRSRWTHPTLSSDGLGKHLGRAKNFRLDSDKVRGDLYLSETAFDGNPNGNMGDYLLRLAEEDPDALSSSLVLDVNEIPVLNAKGKPELDDDGYPVSPIWMPTALHASDIVDTGDAVDGLLSKEALARLPDAIVRQATKLINQQFGEDAPRALIEARCLAWFKAVLDDRFGPDDESGLDIDLLRRKLALKRKLAEE